jgi:fructoselysine-6-P-deglycase FrlB-like protein
VNSIEAMELEVISQLEKLPSSWLPKQEKNCLFVGSGDSFAACLAAQHASGFKALCCLPHDLVANPSIAADRVVYFVSISGRTKANILAARAARKYGSETVAVTSNPESPLAETCDDLLKIKYDRTSVTTAGTISFTLSLMTCLSLVMDVQTPKNLNALFAQAERHARAFARRKQASVQSYYILGNAILLPIAVYGALKLNEVIGAKALAYSTEEFCHSPLFSIEERDAILILGSESDKPLSKRLG